MYTSFVEFNLVFHFLSLHLQIVIVAIVYIVHTGVYNSHCAY